MAWTIPGTGEMNRKITFQRRPTLDDGAGNTSSGPWADLYGPASAALRPINGREQIVEGRLAGVQPYEIVVRSCTQTRGVTTSDSAVDEAGVRYDITAIQDPNQRRMWLSMLAKTGGPEE